MDGGGNEDSGIGQNVSHSRCFGDYVLNIGI